MKYGHALTGVSTHDQENGKVCHRNPPSIIVQMASNRCFVARILSVCIATAALLCDHHHICIRHCGSLAVCLKETLVGL